jgi:uncharacterized membrane protein
VLTDFIHLGPERRLFDALVLASFAATALALGFASVLIVQGVVTRARGVLAGWLVAAASLFASSVGIYLGRVKRLNSWDVVSQPHRVWVLGRERLEDPLGNPRLLLFVAGLCCLLAIGYVGLYALSSLAATARARR